MQVENQQQQKAVNPCFSSFREEEVLVDFPHNSILQLDSCKCSHVGHSVRMFDIWLNTVQSGLLLLRTSFGTLLQLGLENAPRYVAY